MKKIISLDTDELIHWFNAIRNVEPEYRTRALDALWSGQLNSKTWLVDELNKIALSPSNIYIFGGWIGILANVLLQRSAFEVLKVRSIDLDPWCESVADDVNKIHEMNGWRFKAITSNMADYKYDRSIHPHIVINTSTEHITQETYDRWYEQIPKKSLVVIQGNNYFSCNEHIRCSTDLDNFISMNRVTDPLYVGSLTTDMYDRYMAIWIK